MAAVGRVDETIVVNDNVYDNNAKEITPAMVRAVLAVLIESSFNLVDDELMNLFYSSGLTLADKFQETLPLASGTVVLGNTSSHTPGQTFTVTGDIASATLISGNSNDFFITVTFTETLPTSHYIPLMKIRSLSASHDTDNEFIVDTFKNPSATSMQIGFRKVSNVNNNITLYLKIFAM